MRNVITVLLVMLISLPALSSYQNKEKSKSGKTTIVDTMEVMPWPWATQCPFPWETISGVWKVMAEKVDLSFSFKVVNQSDVGELYLEIKEYNSLGVLIGEGIGISNSGQLGVRAAIRYTAAVDKRESFGHWLHISSFVERDEERQSDSSFACYERVNKTAVKITDFGKSQDNEAPFLIEKISSLATEY